MAETSRRLLKLLSLLQTTREWPGPELAQRLEVSARTVRNDIERLRRLGYPVEATRGPVGGYKLAAGAAMPPLLLDDDEAVAIAVALRTVAAAGIGGLEESAVQALAKLQQVLPKRLGRRVDVLQANTVRATWRKGTQGPTVDAGLLALIATASGEREVLRFGYSAHGGEDSERRVEPYRLVNLGRRWYLVAYDVVRDDWRTFRVDRMRETRSVGHRFRARELPADDIGEYVATKTRQVQQKAVGTVEFAASADEVAARIGPWASGTIEVLGPDRCRVSLGGRSVEDLAFWLGIMDADFTVVDSPDLAAAVHRIAQRYAAAAGQGR